MTVLLTLPLSGPLAKIRKKPLISANNQGEDEKSNRVSNLS